MSIKAGLIKNKKIDFSKSFIRVVLDQETKNTKWLLITARSSSINEIEAVCPRKCFEIKETDENK